MAEQAIGNIETVEANGEFGLKSKNSPFAVNFYFDEIYDDKALNKFIKSVEKMIRTSKEYEDYICLLRTNVLSLNHDNILHNITTADVDLEFHHYPLTLYEIVETIITHHIIHEQKFTSFSIAKEVMECHSKHMIGLVSLTHTTHELAHSGNLFIAEDQIFGDYKKFLKEYKDGLSHDLLQKLNNLEQMTKANIPSDFKGIL